jgi:hypothetical protein
MPSEKRFDIKRCGVEFDIEKDNILAVLEHSFITDEYKAAIVKFVRIASIISMAGD